MLKYSGLKEKRILVVEDVELNQYLARHIMESWGCIVKIVENGSLAVDCITNEDYDLVLMDIQMPVMDGMEATRLIRSMANSEKSAIPIVALTANALKEERERYLKIGMNDCLAKPFEETALYQMVTKNIKKEKRAGMHTSAVTKEKEATAVMAENKMYDLAMIQAISGGDESFIRRMLDLFLETVPLTLADLNGAAERGDWGMVGKHAHKLKSTIDSMGINELKKDIRAIEAGGKTDNDPELLRLLIGRVNEVMEQVMEQVRGA